MEVIPVIDVRAGVAVAAQRGDRARYLPLVSPLAASADPIAVAAGLRALFPFQILYMADLEGIEGRGADLSMQRRLAEAWPGREIWIDDGAAAWPSPLPGGERSRASRAGEGALESGSHGQHPMINSYVLGSESLTSLAEYESARKAAGPHAPLSLDFRGDDFIGPPALLADAAHWPDRVIVMTLARVGSGEGPDLTRLVSIIERAGARKIYAAGGVRNGDDLHALRDLGVAGALVATALHNGQITAGDLDQFYGR